MTLLDGAEGCAFGPLLRRCRLSAGMTQEDLARASTLSVRAISDLERGRTSRPQRKSVELLAGALTLGRERAGGDTEAGAAGGLVEAAVAARLAPERAGARPVGRPADGGIPCELPPDTADFTARTAELRRLEELLSPTAAPRPARLTLIAGHPGAGKTALAVHAAHRCRDGFPDGQIFVELAPAGGPVLRPADVVRRILHSLGALTPGIGSPEEASARLRAVLARRRVLIVLDDAVAEGQVRCACPAVGGSAVIATCRRRLTALPGAQYVVAGAFSREESLDFLARMIGEERVRAARADAALVAELCGRVPLALRVVGCRLLARPHWTIRTLVEEVLGDPRTRLRELSSGDLTVRAAMAAAFGLLDDRAQGALRRLAARTPDFDLRDAAVLLGCGTARVHRILGDLMDGHLLEVVDGPEFGEPRYVVPPVVRLFAAEGAEAAGAGRSARAVAVGS